jgi:hypothetical protein
MGLTHWLLFGCVLLVGAGTWFVFWPAALIVTGCGLVPWVLFRPIGEADGGDEGD